MGLKYISEFKCADGITARSEIYIDGYDGDTINVRSANGSPIVISYSGETDEPHTRRITSSCALNLVQEDARNVDLLELQSLGNMQGRVRVYEDNVLRWEGYITNDGMQQMFTETPFVFTVSAVDGLKLIDDIDYYIVYSSTSYASRAPINHIRSALWGRLGIQLPINFACEEIECDAFAGENVLAGSVQWSPRGYGYTDFQGNYKSCGWMLENMLASFDLHIYQSGGEWVIRRIPEIVTGEYVSKRMVFTTGDPVITVSSVDANKEISKTGDYILLNDSNILTVKPALQKATVKYDPYVRENIIPNGGFDELSLGSIDYWKLYPTGTSAVLMTYDKGTINGRDGYSADVQFGSDGTQDSEVKLCLSGETEGAGIPIDMNVLFKSMRFGFTFMPLNGFAYSNLTGAINWDNNPMRIMLTTWVQEGGIIRQYCLSQYGFWYRKQTGSDFNRYNYIVHSVTPGVDTIDMYFSGSPIVGDYISRIDSVTEEVFATSYVPRIMSNDLPAFLDYAGADLVAKTDATSYQVIQDGSTGYILRLLRPSGGTNIGWSWGLSDFLRDGSIGVKVDGMKIGDIATINFQGGNDILLPTSEESTDTRVGKLYYWLFVREGQRIVFDDVYVNVDDNDEMVDATVTNGSSGSQDYTIDISSQKTGFMNSSYWTSFYNAAIESTFTDQFSSGANLTECLARSIMSFRRSPSIIFNGDISVYGKSWQFGDIYNIVTLDGKKFLPLSATYNVQMREVTGIVAIECRAEGVGITTKHYSSEEPLSN